MRVRGELLRVNKLDRLLIQINETDHTTHISIVTYDTNGLATTSVVDRYELLDYLELASKLLRDD